PGRRAAGLRPARPRGARPRRDRGLAPSGRRRTRRPGGGRLPSARLLRDHAGGHRPRPGPPGRRHVPARPRPVSARAPAIRVRSLRKAYGAHEAVRGIDFDVRPGEVFGLLGPNGAGKTTTVEILEGYRERDGGEVEVLGVDPWHADPAHRARIGVVLQHSDLPALLTVREVHAMFAGYFARPRDVDEVVELVGLSDKAAAQVKTLSGGQHARVA